MAVGPRPIPDALDALDAQWLTGCLRDAGVLAPDACVAELRAERIAEASGFAGVVGRLTLRYSPSDTPAPASVIAKFASAHAPTRALLEEVGGYEREVRFYRSLAGDAGIATPRCYFAHHDPSSFLILLEDMAPARSVPLEVGLDLAQCEFVLDQLAQMHARFWNREDELAPMRIDPGQLRDLRERLRAALPTFGARHGVRCPTMARLAPIMLQLLDSDELLLAMVQRRPLTLAHNDLHVDNLLLPGPGGGRFALIDWQSYSASRHGASDLARVLSVCVSPELRRSHGTALMRRYHARLCALGVGGYTFSGCKRRVREETVALVTVFALALGTFDFGGESGQRTAHLMADRLECAVKDAGMLTALRVVATLLSLQRALRAFVGRWLRLGPG